MPLNYFRAGATYNPDDDLDTGTNLSNSVKPIENGDPVEETYLQRTPENLRDRSEDIRTEFDDLELVERSDRALVVLSEPAAKIRFEEPSGGNFRFSVSTTGASSTSNLPLYIGPIISPTSAATADYTYAQYYYDDTTNGEFKIVTNKKVYQGAHAIYFRMFAGTQSLGNTPIVTVEGKISSAPSDPLEGPLIITVELSTDDDTLVSGVVTQINNDPDVSGVGSFITATATGASDNAVTAALASARFNSGPVRLYEGDDGSVGGVDGEVHHLPAAQLDAFFGTKTLKEGEALVVDWLDAKTRQAASITNTVAEANLHIVSTDITRLGVDTRNTADAQGAIPICKVFDGRLHFMNGRVFEVDTPAYLVEGDQLRVNLAKDTGTPDGDYMVGAETKIAAAGATLVLPTGTVNSQLRSIIDQLADATGTPSGDEKIGAPAKPAASGATFTLGAGTVKGQLQSIVDQLAAYATGGLKVGVDVSSTGATGWSVAQGTVKSQLNEIVTELSDQTNGASGEHRIGGGLLSGVDSKTLAASSSVAGHMQELLDYYSAHQNNAAPADQHEIGAITDRPMVLVDPSGAGDYTTIQAALSAVSPTVGATIGVKAGTYNESLTFPTNLSASLTLIGIGGYADVNPATPNPAFTFNGLSQLTTTNMGQITIINFKMIDGQATIPKYVTFSGNDFDDGCWVTFRNCALGRESTTAHHTFEFDDTVNVRLEECFIEGYTTFVDGTTATDPFMKVLTGAQPRIEVLNCFIKEYAQFITYDTHSTAELGSLLVDGNVFNLCGYTDTDGSPSTAIINQDDLTDTLNAQITNNTYGVNFATGVSTGAFCLIGGNGTVSNNILLQGFDYEPTGTATYLIYAEGMDISGNHLNSGLGAGISGGSSTDPGARITNNRIDNFDDRTGGSAIFGNNNAVIANNSIYCAATTTAAQIIKTNGSYAVVQGNNITTIPDTTVNGIVTINTNSVVSGNIVAISGTTGSGICIILDGLNSNVNNNNVGGGATGIDIPVGSSGCVVANNSIYNADIGISVDELYCSIIGNIIRDSSRAGTAIDINANYCSINGNTIYNKTIGIDTGTTNGFSVAGNMIYDVGTGITSNGDYGSISGNAINEILTFGVVLGAASIGIAVSGNAVNTGGGGGGSSSDGGTNNGVQFESHATDLSMKYNNPDLT